MPYAIVNNARGLTTLGPLELLEVAFTLGDDSPQDWIRAVIDAWRAAGAPDRDGLRAVILELPRRPTSDVLRMAERLDALVSSVRWILAVPPGDVAASEAAVANAASSDRGLPVRVTITTLAGLAAHVTERTFATPGQEAGHVRAAIRPGRRHVPWELIRDDEAVLP